MSGYTDFKPCDQVEARDAFGEWVQAIVAEPGVEGTHRNGKKIHDFPIVWVDIAGADRTTPWPLEDVRRRA